MGVEDAAVVRFPAGMRVLVVDDDLVCLKLLETLLRKCEYHVTTVTQAVVALEMLRENKFDLVISDVHMPDMDGFKLLELVGLEMDLPVIMLSANSDPKLVMKGVRHGAVDYLVKPVRIQELKNIWQHVVRKNRFFDQGNTVNGVADCEKCPTSIDNIDRDEKLNRKRKDQNGDDDGNESEADGIENDDPATKKKPRVVWSQELHKKFVDAVNELSVEKAFPKKILDLMNVEGLTRENVASHLQKYRLFLRKISAGPSQPTNMATTFGGNDFFDGYGVFCSLAGSTKFQGATSFSSPYQLGGMLGRLNTPAGLSMRGLCSSSSTLIQATANAQTSNNSINVLGSFQPVTLSANQVQPVTLCGSQIQPEGLSANNSASLLHGIPLQQLDQLQQNRGIVTHVSDVKPINVCAALDLTSVRMLNASVSSSFLSKPTLLNRNQSSLNMQSRNAEPILGIGSSSSNLLNYHNLSDSILSAASVNIQNDPYNAFARALSTLEGSGGNIQGDRLIGVQNMEHIEAQRWQEHGPTSSNLAIPTTSGYHGNLDASSLGWSNGSASSTFMHQSGCRRSDEDTKMRLDENYLLEETNILSGFAQNSCETLEDIVGGFRMKQENSEMAASMCGEYSLEDAFAFSSSFFMFMPTEFESPSFPESSGFVLLHELCPPSFRAASPWYREATLLASDKNGKQALQHPPLAVSTPQSIGQHPIYPFSF
ncbi:hypothetical protein Nepgr_032506 [Nepenthes gracilis]|uniref:Two-component response regulator n=1 Tax=Nepenthes gracilis TaxID=150966 RepID=A0AAD3TIR9_NEPGR|nr:hypothetical protein Nepgr_032506 [Nepenthes gracilis]